MPKPPQKKGKRRKGKVKKKPRTKRGLDVTGGLKTRYTTDRPITCLEAVNVLEQVRSDLTDCARRVSELWTELYQYGLADSGPASLRALLEAGECGDKDDDIPF